MSGIRKSLIGRRFGSLVVIAEGYEYGSKRGRVELCKCDCGRMYTVRYSNLTRKGPKHFAPLMCPICSRAHQHPEHDMNEHMRRMRGAFNTLQFANGWHYGSEQSRQKYAITVTKLRFEQRRKQKGRS